MSRLSVEELERLQWFYMKYGTLPAEFPMPPRPNPPMDLRRDYFREALMDIAFKARFDATAEAALRGQAIQRIDVTITAVPHSGDILSCTSSTPGM